MINTVKRHPEQAGNEIFVGNHSGIIEPHLAVLTTIRLGSVAYSIDGERLSSGYRPMFVGQSDHDAYDRIVMARFSAIRRG